MNLFFLHPVSKRLKDPSTDQQLVPLHQPPHSLSEGSEFLDDAIRMEDQLPNYTEESVAAGSPDNLL